MAMGGRGLGMSVIHSAALGTNDETACPHARYEAYCVKVRVPGHRMWVAEPGRRTCRGCGG